MSKSTPVARKTAAAKRAPAVKTSRALREFAQRAEADTATAPATEFAYRIKCEVTPLAEADPHGKDAHAPGAKLDAGKPLPWLMMSGFSRALAEVAKVTTVGAQKYTKNGWASVPEGEERYMEAFGRHLLKLGGGEAIDHDTKCLHKAQMIWNLMASLELELRASEEGAVNVA